MAENKDLIMTALGMMSGTSLDGVDAAFVRTDGEQVFDHGPAITVGYNDQVREILTHATAAAAGRRPDQGDLPDEIRAAEKLVTDFHVQVVQRLLRAVPSSIWSADLVGFHGQTLNHRPDQDWTWQIGDGQSLARQLGLPVVCDFRRADVAAGGQGAPLAPAYHRALVRSLDARPDGPVAVLNIGGVANVTWIDIDSDTLIAFDTGPGNGLLDDWMIARAGTAMDRDGAVAARGEVDAGVLDKFLEDAYFAKPAPKSLDRHDFGLAGMNGLSVEDGAATLARFTALAVARASEHFPAPPGRWLVCGGGRHNPALMAELSQAVGMKAQPVEAVGWRGDAIEAEAFGFLAVASTRGLPISFPSTTGVPRALTGGRRHEPAA